MFISELKQEVTEAYKQIHNLENRLQCIKDSIKDKVLNHLETKIRDTASNNLKSSTKTSKDIVDENKDIDSYVVMDERKGELHRILFYVHILPFDKRKRYYSYIFELLFNEVDSNDFDIDNLDKYNFIFQEAWDKNWNIIVKEKSKGQLVIDNI